jgi:ABC-2 type transport system permease protein
VFSLFLNGIASSYNIVLRGDMDLFLLRPIDPLMMIVARGSRPWHIVYMTMEVAVLAVATYKAQVPINAGTLAMGIPAVAGSVLVNAAINLAILSTVFRLVRIEPFFYTFHIDLHVVARYPLNMYPGFLQRVFTFVVPIAFLGYYPAALMLRKVVDVAFNPYLGLMAVPVGVTLCTLSYVLWRSQLRAYQSTGT